MREEDSNDRARDEIDVLRRERNLYKQLLDLGATVDIEPFLDGALALIADISRARQGYLEIVDDRPGAEPARFWIARGCSAQEVEEIRASFSTGVIAEALATGETIAAASALEDPRFRDRGSVRENRIEAVLCAPIGTDPPIGVLYLQQRDVLGAFSEEDTKRAETFARHVAVFADRLLIRIRHRTTTDPTIPFRRSLRAEGLIGRSEAMARVLREAASAAPRDVNVLLTGPTGTGKTQLARVLHNSGPRSAGPFVELNCATMEPPLVESELFGAMPGAHSTATRRIDGKVAAAHGGTLLLDEITELRPAVQAKLLQFLESRSYYPLGSARPATADVRVIAATNADLKIAMAKREFREDLFYRIQVMSIRVPSLAERREDIADLTAHFCACACAKHHFREIRLSPGALRAAEAAEWPGNLRQLGHAIEAAVIRAADEGLPQVSRRHLFPEEGATGQCGRKLTFQEATKAAQKLYLQETLIETDWNIAEAAKRLDLARSHVYGLVRAFGLDRRPD